MSKTEVYSWRLDPALKIALEEAARAEQTSVAELLDRIVSNWLTRVSGARDDQEFHRRLCEAAARVFGTIRGGDRSRSSKAREHVRERLRRKRASQGTR